MKQVHECIDRKFETLTAKLETKFDRLEDKLDEKFSLMTQANRSPIATFKWVLGLIVGAMITGSGFLVGAVVEHSVEIKEAKRNVRTVIEIMKDEHPDNDQIIKLKNEISPQRAPVNNSPNQN